MSEQRLRTCGTDHRFRQLEEFAFEFGIGQRQFRVALEIGLQMHQLTPPRVVISTRAARWPGKAASIAGSTRTSRRFMSSRVRTSSSCAGS